MRLVILDADGVPDPSAIGTSGSRRLYGLPPPVCVTLSKHILIVSRPLEGIVWDAVKKINQTRKALRAAERHPFSRSAILPVAVCDRAYLQPTSALAYARSSGRQRAWR